jgi:putative ABC transport system permease protein
MSLTARIRAAFTAAGHAPDDDVIEELGQHAGALYERARADGDAHDEALARVDAQIALWADDAALRARRPRRAPAVLAPPISAGRSPMAGLAGDIRYAVRMLRRQWTFALLVTATMAIGIGAMTALFSVTYGVLMKPLPWEEADRIVRLEETRGGNRPRFNSFTNAAYYAWRDEPSTIEAIGAWQPRMLTLTGAGEAERIRVTAASASLFEVLRPRPILGGLFTVEDELNPVVVLSEGLWRQRFGADPGILGNAAHLEGQPYTVVGVLPDEAGFPDREIRAWVPMRPNPTTGNNLNMFNAVARLRPGATAAHASDEGTSRGLASASTADMDMVLRAVFGDAGAIRISATPLPDAMAGDVRRPLLILLAAVLLLFVTATANVASLQLARATTRRREIAIRSALGAGQARVTRQLLVENLLLGLSGGAAGLALAIALHRALPTLLPADFPRIQDLSLDAIVIAFAAAVSVAASLAVGLAPAWSTRRLNLTESLSEDGAAPAGAGWRSRPARARMTIMAGQVAIACLLLVGASLLGRSFLALVDADRGFDPSSTLTARLQLPGFALPTERRAAIVDAILDRVRAMPGVRAASYSDVPVLGTFGGAALTIDDKRVQASTRTVTPGYFAAMGIPLVGGRDFSDDDVTTGRPVFVVSRTFAREFLAAQPVGQYVRTGLFDGTERAEVIGVVEDVRHGGATEPAGPMIYFYRSSPRIEATSPTLIVRTAGDPLALVPTLRGLAKQEDASLVFDSIRTLEDTVMTTLARPRLYAALIAAFAAFALVIAAVGLLGVLSYAVSQRSRELAVRSALGARPPDLVRLVLRQGLVIVGIGIAAGLLAAAALSQSLASLLYGLTTRDPVTYMTVPAILLAVGAVACLAPALRAARTDPLRVLKGE